MLDFIYDLYEEKFFYEPFEMDELAKGLEERGIAYTRRKHFDGEQIVVNDENGNRLWDAVLFHGSYGSEAGLLEIMGNIVRVDDDTVEGYLTADKILARL